ncbi:hypothetical protein H9649_07560 [Sporosarcina sp. Sa2YVA2]|uniref:Uncharacterized protein n=1 Tax=Sporosarcina quadrami TaxID=2762234 RepID=A0ABR8U8Q7_9BACL|nr:hypothetical protein [Sporosarcina quadrami]MBD7984431.1 hypothetical protein [Sporosarcina quadrami]
MTDELLAHRSGEFIELDLHSKYNMTFWQFVKSYESKYIQDILEKERGK